MGAIKSFGIGRLGILAFQMHLRPFLHFRRLDTLFAHLGFGRHFRFDLRRSLVRFRPLQIITAEKK